MSPSVIFLVSAFIVLFQILPDRIVDIPLERGLLSSQLDLQAVEKRLFKPDGHLTPLCLDCGILLVITGRLLVFASFLLACWYIEISFGAFL